MIDSIKIGLGTVQFGMNYGINNDSGRPSLSEVKQIMVFVGGVHQDPATSYGVSTTTLTFTSAVPNGEIVNVVHDLYSTDVT